MYAILPPAVVPGGGGMVAAPFYWRPYAGLWPLWASDTSPRPG